MYLMTSVPMTSVEICKDKGKKKNLTGCVRILNISIMYLKPIDI